MPKQLDASFVTEVVMLLTWALTTWYVYFTFRESGHAKRKTIALTLGVCAGIGPNQNSVRNSAVQLAGGQFRYFLSIMNEP